MVNIDYVFIGGSSVKDLSSTIEDSIEKAFFLRCPGQDLILFDRPSHECQAESMEDYKPFTIKAHKWPNY
jgi:hypothetical protein